MARKHRDVMKVLVSDIVSGARSTGDMLPKEVELASEFDVSRGVARETIRAMEERGLISVKHGRGATVNGPEAWDIFDPLILAATLDSERSGEVLGEYLECRQVLEVEAAGLAAKRATEQDLKKLAEAFARMDEAAARPASSSAEERFLEADVAFHQALIAATGNRAMGGLVERIHSALFLARHPLARPQHRHERGLPEHRRILDAVTAGDAEGAREAMRAHLETVARYLGEHREAVGKERGNPAKSIA